MWIDETVKYNAMYSRSRGSSPLTSDGPDDPLGISDEANESVFYYFIQITTFKSPSNITYIHVCLLVVI